MSITFKQYADLVRCSPTSECGQWGLCARSLPADPSHRIKPRFEHFGPPYKQGTKCPHLIRLPKLREDL